MARARTVALVSAGVLLLASSSSIATDEYGVTYESNVPVKMRDGVTLRADIYRPNADGKFPVLLQRTPYNKDGDVGFGLKAAARGYVVIIQDVRGRYASEGEWYTFKHEPNDGYDTVEWAAALPYSDGRVGMFGGSYVGATQMLAAIAHPPHLAGICPFVTASNYHSNWTYQGGAFQQWFNESWTSGLAQNTFNRDVSKRTNATKGIWQLPLGSLSPVQRPRRRRSTRLDQIACAVLPRLARASERGRVLEAVVHRGALLRDHRAAAHDCRLVRHLPGRLAPQLHRRQGAWRNRGGAPGSTLARGRRRSCGGRAENRRRRLRARLALRRRGGHAGVVRLPVQGRQERVRREAREDLRDGRQSVARGRRLAARPRAGHEVFPALDRQGELAAREWHAVNGGAWRDGSAGSVRLRSGEPRADHRRTALLRRRAPAAGSARSASGRSARGCARVFDRRRSRRTWKSPAR